MKLNRIFYSGLMLAALAAFSCEKPILEENETEPTQQEQNQKGNLVLRVSDFRLVSADATRGVVDITEYCSRLNFVVYKDGKKVDSRTQTKGDSNFGETAMTLEPGTYKLLVLAHSSNGGNPTLTDPESIHFTNALGFSDTFYFYDDIEVTSQQQTHEVTLTRASSMLRFIINDEVPSNLKYIQFYYTGGSGVLNAVTGYGGLVNSKQEMLYNVDGYTQLPPLRVYTFLQEDEAKLDVTVTALDANKNTIVERKFENVPMKRNMVTEYSGSFFDHSSENSFTFKAETDWEVYQQSTYAF
ncbi:MAG: FimB/Mfa2 family fimbrial subunit [Prevotella sp.]|nr:FimB/Mfa2 family fimbrial subunit [Prevotella sp.]